MLSQLFINRFCVYACVCDLIGFLNADNLLAKLHRTANVYAIACKQNGNYLNNVCFSEILKNSFLSYGLNRIPINISKASFFCAQKAVLFINLFFFCCSKRNIQVNHPIWNYIQFTKMKLFA